MFRRRKPTPRGLDLVQQLQNAIENSDQLCVTHRILIDPQDGTRPRLFTVDLFHAPGDLYVATCWELPLVLVAGFTEEDTLAKAEVDIRYLLAARPFSSH